MSEQMAVVENMWHYWKELWASSAAWGDPLKPFDDLVERYGEAHRSYHVLEHPLDMLETFAEFRALTHEREAVAWGIFYHDAAYTPGRSDNELQSADRFRSIAGRAHLARDLAECTVRLILSTKTHAACGLEEQILSDLDLMILGAGRDKFDRYEQGIRTEHGLDRHPELCSKRRIVLCEFQNRPVIFRTHYMRRRFEEQARANLRYLILRYEQDS